MIVFDPSANNSLEMYIKQFGEHNVTIIKNQLDFRLDQVQTPIVWSHRPLVFDNIPLLISHVGLIAGAEKSMLIQNTEKLIYFNQRL